MAKHTQCFTCPTKQRLSGKPRDQLANLFQLGWRFVMVRGLKWLQCPDCAGAGTTRKR